MTINHELSTLCSRPFRTTNERERNDVRYASKVEAERAVPGRRI
jgi:hypothetical protein